jgi:uncharacterized RDD family membrane protein YckC
MSASARTDRPVSESTRNTVLVMGFRKRLLASVVIDGLLMAFLTFIVVITVTIIAIIGSPYETSEDMNFNAALAVTGLITSMAYYVGFWAKSGQTVGKDLMGIKVVRKDGQPPGWGWAFVRYIGYIISGVVLSLGFIWILVDKKRQGWHDKIAGTYAIDAEYAFTNVDDVNLVPEDPGMHWGPIVVWVILALAAPTALLAGLWPLGPTVNRLLTDLVQAFN